MRTLAFDIKLPYYNQKRQSYEQAIDSQKKKVIAYRPGLKVVQFYLTKGDRIPEHNTNANIVDTTVKGRGIFTIGSTHHEMCPGVVLEMSPLTPHAIEALKELEFVMVHMYLEEKINMVSCGADSFFSQKCF